MQMQAATQITRHEAVKIEITRGEGPTALCGRTISLEGADCWEQARRWLWSQCHTFPARGGYDKHDFRVHFSDGYVYEGRLDCKHASCGDNDLNVATHVRGFLRFYAGERRPPHMTPEQYEGCLRHNPDAVAECRDILTRYEIPER